MREKIFIPRGAQSRAWLHHNRGANYFMHCHEDLEINLAIRGEAAYLVKDQRYNLTARTMLWLFPDQEHLLIEQSADFQMWILVFRRPFTRRTCTGQARVLASRDPGILCAQLPEDAARRLTGLYRGLQLANDDIPRLNAGAAYALLDSFAAFQSAETTTPLRRVHPAIEQAARLLHTEPAKYDLPQLADAVGLSASRLSRLFRRQMGLTMVCYRQRRLLEKFLDLYSRSPDRKLMALAMQAGFGSYPQFHRVFRREMGLSPARFIRDDSPRN